jgi:hypothetical protein
MTQIIFLEWLNAFDLHVANRKVLLVLDNCSAQCPPWGTPCPHPVEKHTCLVPSSQYDVQDPALWCWHHPQF